MLSVGGICFATLSTSANGISSTRPTSRDHRLRLHRPEGDDLGDVLAAVLAGDVLDHLAAARSQKSMSMSGSDMRSGLRKRSKISSKSIGSTSVMRRQ